MQAILSKLREYPPKAVATVMRSLSRKNRILIGILVVAGVSVSLIYVTAPEPAVVVVEEETWPVTTMLANPAPVSPQIILYGRVETPRTALLTASVNAHVRSVPALEGQLVQEDDLLIMLDNTDAKLVVDRYRADLAEATANLESLRLQDQDNREILAHEKELYGLSQKKVQRHKQLRSNSSISEEILNSVLRESHLQAISLQAKAGLVRDFENRLARSQARLQRAEASLKEAQVQLARTEIRAPFDGKVTKVYLATGERVSVGTNLVELYDTASLEIRAPIPSRVLSKLQHALLERSDGVGLKTDVSIDGVKLNASLARLSGKVSAGHSGVDGLFKVLDESEQLVLGRAVNLILYLPPEADVVTVPIQSIYGEDRLFLVKAGRLQGITIERLGEYADNKGHFHVLVRAPELKSSDQIVTTQLTNAISGLKVSVNNEQPAIAVDHPDSSDNNS